MTSERFGLDTPLVALAAILLGCALQINNGFYAPTALALVLAAGLLAGAGLVGDWTSRLALPGRDRERILVGILLAGLGFGLALQLFAEPGMYLRRHGPHPFLIGSIVLAGLFIVLMVRDRARARWLWFPALLLTAAGMGIWLIHASPKPHIDVMTVHKFAIAALRAGHNPYAIVFPDIYHRDELYAPELTESGWVLFGLPYPPLSLLMAIPGQLWARDIRYAELLSLLVGAGFLGYAGRGIAAPLAAALLVFTPRSLFVLEQGWTESFAILWLGAAIFAACRLPRLFPWMLALLVSVKQHMVLALPLAPLILPQPIAWRAAVRLMLPPFIVPLLFALPFLVWNADAFLRSVIWLQLAEPFRPDSLSILSLLAEYGWTLERGQPIMLIAPLLAVTTGFAIAWWRAPRTAAGFAGALGFTLLLLFACSKKAFCNYYFFVIAALCAAIAASDGWRNRSAIAVGAAPGSRARAPQDFDSSATA